jgi:hypothetical protein
VHIVVFFDVIPKYVEGIADIVLGKVASSAWDEGGQIQIFLDKISGIGYGLFFTETL